MTDRLDGQLLTLTRVAVPPPPSREVLEAIVERNRVQRRRARLAAASLAVVAALGMAGLVSAMGHDRPDVATNVGAGPDVNNPDAGANTNSDDVATPDAGGGDDVCGLAGPGSDDPVLLGQVAEARRALEARFPSCFGGMVTTGPSTADLYVVDEVPEVLQKAQQLLPGFRVTMLPSDAAMADIRALKNQMDDDAAQLHAAGIPINGTGIRIESEGPRVLVGLSPYTPAAARQLEESYGADWLVIEEYGAVIPGSG